MTRLPTAPTPLVGRRLELASVAALLAARRRPSRHADGARWQRQDAARACGGRRTRAGARRRSRIRRSRPGRRSGARAGSRSHRRSGCRVGRVLGRGKLAEHSRTGLLLLLDNFEQVAAAAGERLAAARRRAAVARADHEPAAAPDLRGARVPGSAAAELRAGGAPFEEVAASDAVRLFLARAGGRPRVPARPTTTSSAVVAICRGARRPAARDRAGGGTVQHLPPEIALRLDRALELLSAGPGTCLDASKRSARRSTGATGC